MTGDAASMDAQAEILQGIVKQSLNVTAILTNFVLNCIFDRLDCSLTQANMQYVPNIRYGACFTFGAQLLNTTVHIRRGHRFYSAVNVFYGCPLLLLAPAPCSSECGDV